MNVTAGIGMVWVRLRHLSVRDTSMCAHSDNGHRGKEGAECGGGGVGGGAGVICVFHPITLRPVNV